VSDCGHPGTGPSAKVQYRFLVIVHFALYDHPSAPSYRTYAVAFIPAAPPFASGAVAPLTLLPLMTDRLSCLDVIFLDQPAAAP
jgi:hypothetical protein